MARILIVDDHPNVLKSLCLGLRREGFEVETASSGESAMELARGMEFDWIVTDLDMPQMSGEELIGKIREIQPNIHIIVISSRFIPEGMSEFPAIQKPFLFEELLLLLGFSEG